MQFDACRKRMQLVTAFLSWLIPLLLLLPLHASSETKSGELRIFFVDVEGGQATLFVSPTHQSLLVDTGWPGNNGRDADRIVAAAKLAGLSKIDYVLITHFHTDHVGGLPQLAERIPIGTVIDHGDNRESTDAPTVEGWQAYKRLLSTHRFKRLTLKPGDKLPIRGLEATAITADGSAIDHPLQGEGRKMTLARTLSITRPIKPRMHARWAHSSLSVNLESSILAILRETKRWNSSAQRTGSAPSISTSFLIMDGTSAIAPHF